MNDIDEHICVIGAGIIGVSCALELRKAGYQVTIVSKDPPGACCSFGAAGNYGGNVHYAIPNIAFKVPGMYLNKRHPFSFHLRDTFALSHWFGGYAKASKPQAAQRIAQTFADLGKDVYSTYTDWLTNSGNQDLIVRRGRLFVWTTEAGFNADQYGIEFRRRQGIAVDILSPEQAKELEPALPQGIFKAAYTPDAGHLLNPVAVVEALLSDFRASGGNVIQDAVRHVSEGDRDVSIALTNGTLRADQVVVAMGVDSASFTKRFGVKVPLVAERGYHVMFEGNSSDPKIPVMWEERKVLFTGMDLGLRVAGIAEFMAAKRQPQARFARQLETTTQEFFPQYRNRRAISDWSGYRPVTPDYLPVIGRSREESRIICAYGHGHSGYWFAPRTAQLVKEVVTRRITSQAALLSMSPRRFS